MKNYESRIMQVLNKFDHREAERVLDFLADEDEKGHKASKEEKALRRRLEKCLEAYERTSFILELG